MIRRGQPAGIKSYENAKRFAASGRKAETVVYIKDSLRKIGLSYKKLSELRKKPGLSSEQKRMLDEKISRLTDLQEMNLSLARKNKLKL